jgi:hypothetical protein
MSVTAIRSSPLKPDVPELLSGARPHRHCSRSRTGNRGEPAYLRRRYRAHARSRPGRRSLPTADVACASSVQGPNPDPTRTPSGSQDERLNRFRYAAGEVPTTRLNAARKVSTD